MQLCSIGFADGDIGSPTALRSSCGKAEGLSTRHEVAIIKYVMIVIRYVGYVEE